MALTSPRFAADQRLQRAADSRPAVELNETGEAVRKLQQALMDLGFSLPISIRRYGSPDGVYGKETANQVREFQIKYRLLPDGKVGRQTLTQLDALLPSPGAELPSLPVSGYVYKIRLHLRSIAMPMVGESQQLRVMQEIYAQYAIKVEMASGQSVGLNPGEALTLTTVDGDCQWDQVSDEQRLLQTSGSRQGVGPNDITVYFATTLREQDGNTLQGCAGSLPERPAVMIASDAVDKTTMAHEVGHILLGSGFSPTHTSDSKNLMCSAAVCTGKPAYLNDQQLKAIRTSRFMYRL
jgi:peptidoglycan hydrolase-like protein with peptidoglycan-binding domain